jgi:hypothetical protein
MMMMMIMMMKMTDSDNNDPRCNVFLEIFLVTDPEKKFLAFMEVGGLGLLPCPQKPVIIDYLIPSQLNPVYTLPPYSLSTVIFSTNILYTLSTYSLACYMSHASHIR